MSRINEVISGIEGVGVGQTATVKLTTGRRYHMIKLFPTGTDLADVAITDASLLIENVEMYVAGKLQRNVPSEFLKKLPAANGITVPANCLAIYFSEPWRASVMDEQATAWDVTEVKDFTLRIKFRSGIKIPALSGKAIWDLGRAKLPDGTVIYNIIKQEPFNWNAGIGYQEVTNLPLALPIQRLWLTGAAASQITALDVTVDDVKAHDQVTEAENNAILSDYKLDGSLFDYSYVTDPHQQLFDSLIVRKNFKARIYTASAGAINGILETRANSFL